MSRLKHWVSMLEHYFRCSVLSSTRELKKKCSSTDSDQKYHARLSARKPLSTRLSAQAPYDHVVILKMATAKEDSNSNLKVISLNSDNDTDWQQKKKYSKRDYFIKDNKERCRRCKQVYIATTSNKVLKAWACLSTESSTECSVLSFSLRN